jgi:hypothetical protein
MLKRKGKEVFGGSVHVGCDVALLLCTFDDIPFPIASSDLVLNETRPLIDKSTIGDKPAPIFTG